MYQGARICVAEVWKPVVGYEGLYAVSNFGDIRNVRRGWNMNGEDRTKVVNVGDSGGHLYVTLYKENRGKRRHVAQHVLEAFVGPRPEGCGALHVFPDPEDNCVWNLFWGDQLANIGGVSNP
jgi:hypothetical protein